MATFSDLLQRCKIQCLRFVAPCSLNRLYNWLWQRKKTNKLRVPKTKQNTTNIWVPTVFSNETNAIFTLRPMYVWCLHLGNMFHVLSSHASSFGFTMSWKHLQWKSYLSITCVTLKVNTKVFSSICSCLFWRVAVHARLQNTGSGFKGETSTQ